jgi:NAD(P)-dependent dehydrogenase (short-subunit alcohol dehydrogenase family)
MTMGSVLKLSGETILITGGTAGICHALAKALAPRNTVIITGRNEEALQLGAEQDDQDAALQHRAGLETGGQTLQFTYLQTPGGNCHPPWRYEDSFISGDINWSSPLLENSELAIQII